MENAIEISTPQEKQPNPNLRPVVVAKLRQGLRKQIKLSRNVWANLKELTTNQINTMTAISDGLYAKIQVGDTYDFSKLREDCAVMIPYELVSKRHAKKIDTLETLRALMKTSVVYSYAVPKEEEKMAPEANLIGGLWPLNDGIRVEVTQSALPMYVCCGIGVGYLTCERDVAIELSSKGFKLLYFAMTEKINNKTGMGTIKFTIDEIREIFEVTDDKYATASRIQKRYIEPFLNELKELDSKLKVSYIPEASTQKGKGRPNVVGYCFRMTMNKGDVDATKEIRTVLDFLLRHIAKIETCYDSVQKASEYVLNCLIDDGGLYEFEGKMKRLVEKHKTNGKEHVEVVAKIMKKVLAEDFSIFI